MARDRLPETRWCKSQIACDGAVIPSGSSEDCGACRKLALKRANAAKKPALRGMNVKFTEGEGRTKRRVRSPEPQSP